MAAPFNIVVELERCGQTIVPLNEDEVKIKCPFHDDDAPSCAVNTKKCVFKCHAASCGKSGDGFTLIAGITKNLRAVVYADLAKRYGIEDVKVIDPQLVERYHIALDDYAYLKRELYDRGVTDVDIRKYRLGASDKGRVTIPIPNRAGDYVNVRHYAPGAAGADKMRNVRGHSKIRLFPVEQLQFEKIIVCGGEIKAIVTARVMNKYGYGAITATAGEGNWDIEFTADLKGKEVWLMFDIDEGGRTAVKKIAPAIHTSAKRVRVVELPLDLDKYPHGDVNDFVAREQGDLKPVIESARLWEPKHKLQVDDAVDPTPVRFTKAYQSANVGKKLSTQATVTAAGETSFVIPRSLHVTCDKDQTRLCSLCAMYPRDLEEELVISNENPAVLGMVDVSHKQVYENLKNAVGIPSMCGACVLQVNTYYDAELVQLSPAIDVTNLDTERRVQPALFVDAPAELNSTANLVGRLYPHPKTQQATLVVSRSEITHDALTNYQPDQVGRFRVFRAPGDDVESISKKLDDIYDDLESNVTRIFMRRDLHLMIDLAYHSVLFLDLDGKRLKAWVEVLVIGDNGQGKTETATHLQRHYRLGEFVDCKNASSAGLLGGMQKFGDAWYVSWGALPSNDRRLVIFEELKGASTNDIAHLTSARSSGLAEIVKIKKRRTHSRTRIVALSNARENRSLSSFPHAIDSVLPLIGAPEDVRRFDVALTLMSSDTDADELMSMVHAPSTVTHRYTSDYCHDLVLWAWTRTPEQVIVQDDAREELTRGAKYLASKYVDSPPLIDRSTTRAKLARLSAALACRLFSTDPSMESVLVKKSHVEFIIQTLDRIYSAPNSGYAASSQNLRATTELGDVREIHQYLLGSRYPRELQQQLIYADQIDIIDVQDWLGTSDRQEAQTLLSLLVRKRAIVRRKNKYVKTPPFIEWLKSLDLPEGGPPNDTSSKEKF